MENDIRIYETYIDLYKFYWGLAIQLVSVSLGLSGAISAYCIANQQEALMSYSLAVPIIFVFFVAWLSHTSEPGMKFSQDEVTRVCNNMGLSSIPQFRSLLRFMHVSKYICVVVGLGLIVLFIRLSLCS